jgi:hypothetical protein
MSLADITTRPEPAPPRMVIHGAGGVGKTTFAAQAPGVIFLPAEEGLGILNVPHFPRPTTYEEVLQRITTLLRDPHEYRTFVIDTVDALEPLVWDAVCRDKTASGSKTYENIEDFGYGKGYIFADAYWIRLLKGLDALRREKKMTTIVLAHSETRTIHDPQIGPYDKWITKIHKRADALLYEWSDLCGYASIESQASVKGEGKKVTTAVATGRRTLSLEDSGAFRAKNRYGLSPRMDLDYKLVRDAIAASFTRTPAAAPESNTNENERKG